MIVFERANLLFIFNFHPTNSFADYRVGVEWAGEFKVALSTDESRFGGHDRIDVKGKYFTTPMEWNGRKNWLQVRMLAALVSLCSFRRRRTIVRGNLRGGDD